MKKILYFILPILIVAGLTFTIFSILQVKFTEKELIENLKRQAKNVAESLDFTAKEIILKKDLRLAERLNNKFEKRDRVQGCIIYDKNKNIIAITKKINWWSKYDHNYLNNLNVEKSFHSNFQSLQKYNIFLYAIPILDDGNNIIGYLEILYETTKLNATIGQLWKQVSINLIILLFIIGIITFLIQWRTIILPMRKAREWFTSFQKGETDKLKPFNDTGEFGKFISEVEQVALHLRVARKIVTSNAEEKHNKENNWNEEKLKNLVQAKIGENAFIVVSNREPFMHVKNEDTGQTKCIQPASGVVTAIDPILKACGGIWIAHGSGNADKKFVNSKNKLGVPPKDIRYILKRVWLTKEEEEGYYYGFSNEGLWPLCHITYTRPIFKEKDWQMYKKVNQIFADSIIEELPNKNAVVFIQDYHFTLLPQMIKEKRPDTTIALFWHIPWPNPEVFSICPYQKEILEGMLSCDLIGFHTQFLCNNFLETANRLIECRIDTEKFSVNRGENQTYIRNFPISIDDYFLPQNNKNLNVQVEKIKKEYHLNNKIIAVSVERIDYTKGLLEKFQAIERFLEKYPKYINKFVLIQLAAPSRSHIKSYHDLMSEIDQLVERINWRFSENNWKPIIYLKRHFSPEEIKPYFALGEIGIISSLHDGMNLVAKEYILSKEKKPGVLILSKFAGASKEMIDAIQINPYSIEEFATAIKQAIEMPKEERVKRHANMFQEITQNNIYKWAAEIITEITNIQKS